MEKKNNNALFIVIALVGFVIVMFYLPTYMKAINQAENKIDDTSKEYSIGDTVRCNEMSFTLEDVKYMSKGTKTNGYIVTANELVAIYGTLKNIDDDEIQTGTNQFRLINSNGEIIENSSATYANWGDYKMLGSKLAVGGSQKGFVEFANTNTDNSNLKLEFDCMDSSVGTYTFSLNKEQ